MRAITISHEQNGRLLPTIYKQILLEENIMSHIS